MYGGELGHINAFGGTVNLYGGSIATYIVSHGGYCHIYGYDLSYDPTKGLISA